MIKSEVLLKNRFSVRDLIERRTALNNEIFRVRGVIVKKQGLFDPTAWREG